MLSYQNAMDESTMVSVDEAYREIREHGFQCGTSTIDDVVKLMQICGQWVLFDAYDEMTIAAVDEDGMVHSADVMAWLGY